MELLTSKAIQTANWSHTTAVLLPDQAYSSLEMALHMDDMELKEQTITVTKTLDPIHKIVTAPKTLCSNREVYMQPELLQFCRKIRSSTLAGHLKYGYQTTSLCAM